jgi:hypothetical protein
MIPSARMHVSGKPPERAHVRPTQPTTEALRRLIWPLRLTRAGMVAERATRAFWPLWSLLFAALAAIAFGALPALGYTGIWIAGALALGLIAWALLHGIRAFACPAPRRRWTGWTRRCPAVRSRPSRYGRRRAIPIRRRSRSGRFMSRAWPGRASEARAPGAGLAPVVPRSLTRCATWPRRPWPWRFVRHAGPGRRCGGRRHDRAGRCFGLGTILGRLGRAADLHRATVALSQRHHRRRIRDTTGQPHQPAFLRQPRRHHRHLRPRPAAAPGDGTGAPRKP